MKRNHPTLSYQYLFHQLCKTEHMIQEILLNQGNVILTEKILEVIEFSNFASYKPRATELGFRKDSKPIT